MAENSNKIPKIDPNKQKELTNHARSSAPSSDPKKNQKRGTGVQNPKAQIKKKLLTTAIKKVAGIYGMEGVADQALKTEMGQKALNDAANAPTIKSGAEAFVKRITYETLIKQMIPIVAASFMIIILLLSLVFATKATDGQGAYSELQTEIARVVSAYRPIADIDGNLILATLIAYDDAEGIDESSNLASMRNYIDDLAKYQMTTTIDCSIQSIPPANLNPSNPREIAANDGLFGSLGEENYNCVVGTVDHVKSVDSIEEGNYDDPNSGSVYYWNLIDENFIFGYYNDYMINKDDNTTGENVEKINDIISEIYLYYDMMEKLTFQDVRSYLCSSTGITVDGVTMDFEEYIKGVVYAETKQFNNQIPLEVLKAIAVYARSEAISYTSNCVIEMRNSENTQLYEELPSTADPNITRAVEDTVGEYLYNNGNAVDTNYFLFPGIDDDTENVECSGGYCTATLYYDRDDSLGTYTISIEDDFAGVDVPSLILTLPPQNYGMSILEIWETYEQASNPDDVTYDQLINNTIPIGTEIKKMGSEGLVATEDGFLMRVSRPLRDNTFYYTPDGSAGAAGTLEGECAWYATGRAKEILENHNIDKSWSYNGNGGTYCDWINFDKNKFNVSTNYNEPRPGAIISWKQGRYGHVAIVESVQGSSVTISQAGLGFGPHGMFGCGDGECVRGALDLNSANRRMYCEKDGSGCFSTNTMSIESLKVYSGDFQCYIYLTQPK